MNHQAIADDRPCPHCDGANTGHFSAGKLEFYTTRVQRAGGGAVVYACCSDNRKHCLNFRAVQILRERCGGAAQLTSK